MLYSDIQDYLNQTDQSLLPKLNFVVLRNITIEPIEPYIMYLSIKLGYSANIRFGGYDNVYQESVSEQGGLFDENVDCILVYVKLETLSWNIANKFTTLTAEQRESECSRIKDNISAIVKGIRKKSNALILWHSFEHSVYPALGILDSQTKNGQLSFIDGLNSFTLMCLEQITNAYLINLNLVLARIGYKDYYDSRYWHLSHAPYSREAMYEIACEEFKFIRAFKGKNKKCLILDCDNTLWGGIAGEDGLAGIKLGSTYPGSAYKEFQQEIVNLFHRGVILAICSKNNEDDIWEIFNNHPDMLLKKEHIAAAKINWQNKATNIELIAKELNIGIDSIVFVDDSEFEINFVRNLLPEVEAIYLDKNKITEFRTILASSDLFDSLTISLEDKKRGEMYQNENIRKKMKSEIANINEYYRSLEMIAEIHVADAFSIPRIAQLTQKTNQFNLTTRRYSENEIKAFVEDTNSDVLYIRVYDKFGDLGIVGVCIIKYIEHKAYLDTFLLSCRALGRGVENVFIVNAMKLAKKKGAQEIVGEYILTKKNMQVEKFYVNHGFVKINNSVERSNKLYYYLLSATIPQEPDFFKNVILDFNINGESE